VVQLHSWYRTGCQPNAVLLVWVFNTQYEPSTLSGMRAHYLACMQYLLVCVGYAYNISYDIIENALLIM
jgi:hypothetical protein